VRSASSYLVVLVTAPSVTIARRLVRLVLQARLAACGNLIPRLESHYWWQGKLEKSAEVLILFKTTTARLEQLEQLILARHPYETPEIVAVPLAKGTQAYLNWIDESVARAEPG
jgi:periplasmic divalent cation tolerance protein